MTAGTKTSRLRQTTRVRTFSDRGKIHLRMTAQTQVTIMRHQHLGMNRAMHLVTRRAAFTDGFVLKNKGSALFFMALKAGFVDAIQSRR